MFSQPIEPNDINATSYYKSVILTLKPEDTSSKQRRYASKA